MLVHPGVVNKNILIVHTSLENTSSNTRPLDEKAVADLTNLYYERHLVHSLSFSAPLIVLKISS